MMYKFQEMVPCKKLSILIRNMLRNRRITVHINDNKSHHKGKYLYEPPTPYYTLANQNKSLELENGRPEVLKPGSGALNLTHSSRKSFISQTGRPRWKPTFTLVERELDITPYPTYFGVTLDRSLTYKLAGTTWGALLETQLWQCG